MSYPDLYDELPPELQEELKKYGPLEQKTSAEIYDIMLKIREALLVPPWHPFTLFMKEKAREVDAGKRRPEGNNVWYTISGTRNRDELRMHAVYEKDETGELQRIVVPLHNNPRTWCYVEFVFKRGDVTSEPVLYAVDVVHKIVWSMRGEVAVVQDSGQVCIRESETNTHRMDLKLIYAVARKAIKAEQMHIVYTRTIRKRAPNKKGLAKVVKDQQQKAIIVMDNMPAGSQTEPEKVPDEPVREQTIEEQLDSLPKMMDPDYTLDRADVLNVIYMFEMAEGRADELKLSETINEWRKTVQKLERIYGR